MANSNALSAYRETRIKTASQGQLIIMLYDGAIKMMDHAIELLKANSGGKKNPSKIEEVGNSIIKAQEIITELMVSLDFEQGGDIARNLFAIYTWFNKELLEAHVSADSQRILVVRDMVNDMRKSWSGAIAKTAADERHAVSAGLNIAG
ncbi:flagellar protein FliS [Spirochaetia bacterium]|nr:flagellar protein FliS [Spirochaetia bacterium]